MQKIIFFLIFFFLFECYSFKMSLLNKLEDRKTLKSRLQLATYFQDIATTTIITFEVIIWLKIWTTLASKEILPSNFTRF